MIEGLSAAFKILGISLVGDILIRTMENYGHGDKVPLVKIALYVACGFIVWDELTNAFDYVEAHITNYRW